MSQIAGGRRFYPQQFQSWTWGVFRSGLLSLAPLLATFWR
jgi:hypothetical protein